MDTTDKETRSKVKNLLTLLDEDGAVLFSKLKVNDHWTRIDEATFDYRTLDYYVHVPSDPDWKNDLRKAMGEGEQVEGLVDGAWRPHTSFYYPYGKRFYRIVEEHQPWTMEDGPQFRGSWVSAKNRKQEIVSQIVGYNEVGVCLAYTGQLMFVSYKKLFNEYTLIDDGGGVCGSINNG